MKKTPNIPLNFSLKRENLEFLLEMARESKLSASECLNILINRQRDVELYKLLQRIE